MSTDTNALCDLYREVAGDEPLTESQQEEPSHDPIEEPETELERELSSFVQEDGLDDAIEGAEM